MIDGIKVNISGFDPYCFLNSPFLTFDKYIGKNGFVSQNAAHRGLNFRIFENRELTITGSLHKYLNAGRHNLDEFDLSDLVEVLMDLSLKFQINPFLAVLSNLEFGFNVELPFDARTFIQGVLNYKGKAYDKRTFEDTGYLYSFHFDHYRVKIYDKGMQFGTHRQILRFEVSVKKMQFFKNKDIHIFTLADLLKPEIHRTLKSVLLEVYEELLIFEPSAIGNCKTSQEREVLTIGKNPIFWEQLKRDNPENFKKKRDRFKQLTVRYGNDLVKNIVRDLILQKNSNVLDNDAFRIFQYLLQFPQHAFPELTNNFTTIPVSDFPRINPNSIRLIQGMKNNQLQVRS